MKAQKASPSVFLLTVLWAMIAALFPAGSGCSEVAATHLVYEKAVKMKKVETVLFLPFLDQSRKSDDPQRAQALHCSVFAEGKGGPLPVSGTFRLRLLGQRSPATPWQSAAVAVSLDDDGQGSFADDDIQQLVQEATAANASIDLFRVEFDGGKGKKINLVTMDCIHLEADS